MTRAPRIILAAGLAALTVAATVSAQAASGLPSGYPRQVFDWAVQADLASRVSRNCRGITMHSELADARLGVALSEAFPNGTDLLRWSKRPNRAAEEARVRALVSEQVVALGAAAGYDVNDRDQLCALGRAQMAAGTPAGELLFTGGRR